jgi:glutaredoxin
MTAMRFVLSYVLALSLSLACTKSTPPPEPAKEEELPPPFDTSAAAPSGGMRLRPGLLFTYLDADGAQRSTEKLEDIPQDRRGAVRVIDLNLPPEARGAGKWVYVADLRAPKEDGTYPYQALSALKFDRAVATAPMRHKVDQGLANAASQVTVYSTSWCGVCRNAKAFLRDRKVAFVERDVEKDESAMVELAEKAKRAGVQPQGVPVIDVYGQLMLGFDEARLVQLLERRGTTGISGVTL